MTFAVRELSLAKADKQCIFEWLHQRSPRGAIAWLAAYDRMIERLERSPNSFGHAEENADLELDIRQVLFRTRQGRVYRALFIIESGTVFILRVRGPGQGPIHMYDIESL